MNTITTKDGITQRRPAGIPYDSETQRQVEAEARGSSNDEREIIPIRD